jgi:hypothetical protein
MVEHTTVRISTSLKKEINEFEGNNFEERLKKWAGVTNPELSEERVREIAREEFEEMSNTY